MRKDIIGMFVATFIVFLTANSIYALAQENKVCTVYFTGIGCSHCAKTDPVLLDSLLEEYPNLVIIEYEIYRQQENAPLIYTYNTNYNSGLGIPLIIFSENENIVGDTPILQNIRKEIEKSDLNECPLADGSSASFKDLDMTTLPGSPKIWTGENILISTGEGGDSELLKKLLTDEDISAVLEGVDFEIVEPEPVLVSKSSVEFENAIKIGNWIFQWNGERVKIPGCPTCPEPLEWSECMEGKQTRIDYRCSAETDYECVTYTETRECDGTDNNGNSSNPEGITAYWDRITILLILVIMAALVYKKVKSG